jgi:4-hydroxy-tetrahydrodipicolinate synthase
MQLRMLEFFDAMLYQADFPEGLRVAVELRGFHMGPSRQPATDAQRIDRAALQRLMQCIISDYGYVAPPAEGCPPRGGHATQDRVAQLAESVLHELRARGVV